MLRRKTGKDPLLFLLCKKPEFLSSHLNNFSRFMLSLSQLYNLFFSRKICCYQGFSPFPRLNIKLAGMGSFPECAPNPSHDCASGLQAGILFDEIQYQFSWGHVGTGDEKVTIFLLFLTSFTWGFRLIIWRQITVIV